VVTAVATHSRVRNGSGPSSRAVAWWALALGSAVVGLLLVSNEWWAESSPLWGGALISGVTVPAVIVAAGARRHVVVVAMALTLLPMAVLLGQRVGVANPAEHQKHDATFLNDEAARLAVRGHNPYGAYYGDVLPPVWHDLGYVDGELVRNPALDTYAYLPASFLVDVPGVVVGDWLGTGWDARLLYLAAVVAAMVVVARRPEPPAARAATILAFAGVPTVYYLGWGTNDAVAASLFLVAALIGERRPRLAGVALAVALSFKVVLAVPAVALSVYLLRRGGIAALRRWWTCPAVLTATILPYFAADPATFLDQTVLFNLNRGDFRFPTLGMGLPAVAGDVFHGPVLAVTVVLGVLGALVVPAVVVWRRPTLPVALVAGGLGLLGVFLPATNFRRPYIVLVVALVSGGWLALRDAGDAGDAGGVAVPDPAAQSLNPGSG
jgi:hypothetical protein